MADDINEQLKKSYDDEGRAQLDDFYSPSVPSGLSGWVSYADALPSTMRFADNAPATLLAVQVWDIIPTKADVVATLGETDKAVFSSVVFSCASEFLVGKVASLLGNVKGRADITAASAVGFGGIKNIKTAVVIASDTNIRAMGDLVLQTTAGRAVFNSESRVPSGGQKTVSRGGAFLSDALFLSNSRVVYRAPFVEAMFVCSSSIGTGGRRIFSYSQIEEADVATIHQGERVHVKFTQGESVERNTFFFLPDGLTPIADLSTYQARMDLREYPDDPNPITTLTSEDGEIFLSDTGLIVWEIPGSITKTFNVLTFGGDLFVYAPDGDAIMVCGFDFEMTLSHTRGN